MINRQKNSNLAVEASQDTICSLILIPMELGSKKLAIIYVRCVRCEVTVLWCGVVSLMPWFGLVSRRALCLIIDGPCLAWHDWRAESGAGGVGVGGELSTATTLGAARAGGPLPAISYLRILAAKPIPPSRHTMEHQLVPPQQLVL